MENQPYIDTAHLTPPTTGPAHGTLRSYSIGFCLSLLLTIIPYLVVVNHVQMGTALVVTILGVAVVQLVVQLLFFLHLGREEKPYWNLFVFLFAAMVIGILVIGSLWIMHNLNYNMTPAEMNARMLDQAE